MFGVLVLRHQAPATAPVSSACATPPSRALASAGRMAAHNDQRAAVPLAGPVGAQAAEGVWLIAARDGARVRVFRAEGGGLVWSATELPARSTDAKTVLRCMHADPETGGVGS
jgi:hypothetical protein